ELDRQIAKLLLVNENNFTKRPLFNTETTLRRGMYSKDFYEPVREEVISMIPSNAKNILSIGCGWGATECLLAARGLRVVALPLDQIISCHAATNGIEMVYGDFHTAIEKLSKERFDCILYLNVLHLIHDPIEILSCFNLLLSANSVVIIQTPNMLYLSDI